MLYKLTIDSDSSKGLEPLAFLDFAALGKVEKDLEILLAAHLLDERASSSTQTVAGMRKQYGR